MGSLESVAKDTSTFLQERKIKLNALMRKISKHISNEGKAEKRFDFVFVGALGTVFACECNFYSGGGSKLNETARSYKTLTLESKGITGFQFVWFTDGTGWTSARHNLEETFDVLDNLYNLEDLEKGAIDTLVNPTKYIENLLENSRK